MSLTADVAATLQPGVVLSSTPWEPETVYGQAWFPIIEPIPVRSGDS